MTSQIIRVDPLLPDKAVIARACEVLCSGGLVVIPTETVYGLAALATDTTAVEKVFIAKRRPAHDPLPVQIASIAQLGSVARETSDKTRRLLGRFSPGPLTVVVLKNPQIPSIVTAGRNTVGVRIPASIVAKAVLDAVAQPLVVTSANLSGQPAPTDAQQAAKQLSGKVDLILDAGACLVRTESTVIDMTRDPPMILRLGAISREQVEQVIGPVLAAE